MEMKARASDDQPLECAMSYVLDGGAANQSIAAPTVALAVFVWWRPQP